MIKKQNSKNHEVRVRIAPSPTGFFHIGTARTALFNFLFAKKNKGSFILRIEDTDKKRSQKHFEQDIIDGLEWLGILEDEGLVKGGKFGPYRQSERTLIYQKYLKKLLKEGKAFYCFEKEEIEQGIGEFKEAHFSQDRDLPLKEAEKRIAQGEPHIIRFKTPRKQKIVFDDLIRGKVEFDSELIGDFSIAKKIDESLYNFAAAIDDYEMQISHVIRGDDHISNTPKQLLIQDALEFLHPQYAHLPLILGPDRTKLSKRHNTVALKDYKNDGYLPEALVNFMAFLGWNPGTDREIFSLPELIDTFSLKRVQSAGAIFDLKRLNWINGYYIRKTPIPQLIKLAKSYFADEEVNQDYLEKILLVSRDRLKKLSDLPKDTEFFFKKPHYETSLLYWKDMKAEDVKKSLQASLGILQGLKIYQFKKEDLEIMLLKQAELFNRNDRGGLLWPLRAALTGLNASPSPFEIAAILGKKESINRIREAIKKI